MVSPFEFERCVLPLGTTTAICDPHEIANVVGVDGIKYFQDSSEQTVMDIFVQLSSVFLLLKWKLQEQELRQKS